MILCAGFYCSLFGGCYPVTTVILLLLLFARQRIIYHHLYYLQQRVKSVRDIEWCGSCWIFKKKFSHWLPTTKFYRNQVILFKMPENQIAQVKIVFWNIYLYMHLFLRYCWHLFHFDLGLFNGLIYLCCSTESWGLFITGIPGCSTLE